MAKSKKARRIERYIYVFLMAMFLLSIYSNCSFFKDYQELSTHSNKDAISMRLNSLHVDLNNFPRTSVNDISFLAKMASTENLLERETNLRGTDLLEFMKQNSAYYQIILLNLEGEEVLKIENLNQNYSEYTFEEQTFSEKSFWEEIKNLNNEEVIVSDIAVEENNDEKIPVLSYATSVFSEGKKKGYLVLKTNSNYFLDNIRYAQRGGEEVFLMGGDGEYLANADTKKEFSLDEGISFWLEYPELKEDETIKKQADFFETEDSLFSFKYITMSKGYFIEYSGKEDSLWVLVSVTDKTGLILPSFWDFIIYEMPTFIILLSLIALIIYKRKSK